MNRRIAFSSKQVVLTFGVIGLLLGLILVGVFLNARSANAQKATITADQAKAAVERAYPEAKVVEVEMDDSGRPAYEVELDNGLEVLVDSTTGAVLTTGADDTDDRNEAEDADGPGDDGEDADGGQN
ncbi:MAG: PepSY domain-containing protein [Chloroflexota bacterium]